MAASLRYLSCFLQSKKPNCLACFCRFRGRARTRFLNVWIESSRSPPQKSPKKSIPRLTIAGIGPALEREREKEWSVQRARLFRKQFSGQKSDPRRKRGKEAKKRGKVRGKVRLLRSLSFSVDKFEGKKTKKPKGKETKERKRHEIAFSSKIVIFIYIYLSFIARFSSSVCRVFAFSLFKPGFC